MFNPKALAAPCLDCKDRYVGCHGKCEKYAKFRKRKEKEARMKKYGGANELYFKKG